MIQIKFRIIIGVMIFFGYFLSYLIRYNLSVHIIDMSRAQNWNHTTDGMNLPVMRSANIGDLIDWDDMKMARLFSAYYIGYCIFFPIFHNMGDRIGPTWVTGIAGMTSGVLTCLTPAATFHSFWVLYAVRMLIGFSFGAMQPSMVQVLRHWVPPIERNYFMWVYCGYTTGTISTLVICGTLQYYSRWHIGFYFAGGVQIVWAAIWVSIVTDTPKKHGFISTEELEYLTKTIGTVFTIKLMNSKAPWRDILRSMAFWALCILNFGYAWFIMAVCIYGPIFYTRVVNYTIYNAAMLTALPFLLRFILGMMVIHGYHWYTHSDKIKPINSVRKYFIFVSHVLPSVLMAIVWVSPVVPGPIILTTAMALTAAGMDITMDLCYEISPNYASSLNIVIKIIGNTPGIIVSYCVGFVTSRYGNTLLVWKNVWCFHGMVLGLSGMVFLLWGDTKVQPWNAVDYHQHRHQSRHRRTLHALPRPSLMSNIIEIDEDENTCRLSKQNSKKRSILSDSVFKIQPPNKLPTE